MPFISMAFIKGQSLRERIKRGPLDVDTALEIGTQVAKGLDEAHSRGVIHRDIKSDNIMLAARGQSKIMDFGLAKIRGGSLVTQEGTFMGTVAYMSPEQAAGQEVDNRSDLWSLGVVLYEMLSGTLPFRADNEQALIYSILNQDPKPLEDFRPEISPDFEQIVLKLLAKNPNLTYTSARELIRDLESLKAGMPIEEPRVAVERLRNSIAVLDFANITRDDACSWLSGGIAETVTVDLKKIGSLSVVSREKVLIALGSLPGKDITERQIINIGQVLRVKWIVWGGFQKMGSAIRITAHFTEVSTGDMIGSAKVDGTMEDIFKLQDNIVTNLMDSLELELSDSERKKIETPETSELTAYEYYAKGRQLLLQMNKEQIGQAVDYLKKAIEIDPEYALAYSSLGSIHTLRFIAQTNPEDLDIGISYLEEALKYDPHIADPYMWLSYAYVRKQLFEEAIQSGCRAVELEPENPNAHYFLGVAYMVQAATEYKTKQYAEAIPFLKRAAELILFQPAFMNLAWIYFLHGQYQEAKMNLDRAVAIEESGKFGAVRFVGALTLMGNLYSRQQKLDKAQEWYARSLALLEKSDHVYRGSFLVLTYYGLGMAALNRSQYDKALDRFRKAFELISQNAKSLRIGYYLINVHLGMARASSKLGMIREEKEQFQKALALLESKKGYDFSWVWEGSDAQAYYEVASYHASKNQQDKALEYLQKAVSCGWRDLPLIEKDEHFDKFCDLPQLKRILKELKSRRPLP